MNRNSFVVLLALGALGCGGAPGLRIEPVSQSPTEGFGNTADPSLTADPATGDLLLSFVAGTEPEGWRLYFARSSDRGATWSAPVVVTADTGEVHPHGEAAPRLVAGLGGRVALVWPVSVRVPSRKWPANRMRFARSLDGGRSWAQPVTINDDTTGTPIGHTFQGAAWVGDSGFVAAWLDERGGGALEAHHASHSHSGEAQDSTDEADASIYAVSSADFGGSWSGNRPMWGAVCPCCRVTLARGPSGSAIAGWRQHFTGNVRDIVVAPLGDSAVAPSRVHLDNWVYPGCPHTGPALSLDSSGAVHVVWFTGRSQGAGVFLARGDQSLRFSGEPIPLLTAAQLPAAHPAVAALPSGGTIAAWDLDASGARRLLVAFVARDAGSAEVYPVVGSDGSTYPQLAALRDGTAALAWTQLRGDTTRVQLARVAPGK